MHFFLFLLLLTSHGTFYINTWKFYKIVFSLFSISIYSFLVELENHKDIVDYIYDVRSCFHNNKNNVLQINGVLGTFTSILKIDIVH